jgi:hypothetical protein
MRKFSMVSYQFKGPRGGTKARSFFELATGNWKLTVALLLFCGGSVAAQLPATPPLSTGFHHLHLNS